MVTGKRETDNREGKQEWLPYLMKDITNP
jgi:hypothetical protein